MEMLSPQELGQAYYYKNLICKNRLALKSSREWILRDYLQRKAFLMKKAHRSIPIILKARLNINIPTLISSEIEF